ncbi:MAG: hypothetical protein C0415_00040 [Thermodesulfovibrio sp.]|nr:hypothetical protein [Thermodesulfovibrio sp.]
MEGIMRKALTIFIILFVFASASFAAERKKQTIKRVETHIAVFDLEITGKVDKNISRPLTESIRLEIVKTGKYEVIDRSNMNKVLTEQKFQKSGCVSGECIVEAGQLLGVGKIVIGSVSIIGSTYYLSLSLVNVETGKIEFSSEDKCKCEVDELIESSKRLTKRLMGESAGEPVKEPTQKSFSLENIEREAKEKEKKGEAEKALWNAKMQEMKKAFNQVIEYEKKDVKLQQKADAWKYFLESFTEDNPHSKEDDEMRKKAKEKEEYYQAMSKRPKDWGKAVTDTTGLEMILVKSGCFQMGSDGYYAHEVCVDDFYIGKYEVTQGQWKAIMGDNPSRFEDCGDNCPVESVSWDDVQEFINKLNQKTEKNYRLPTEAEWEYAARSGGKNEKWAGTSNQSELGEYAWYRENSGDKTHPVGQKKPPNGLGIYDMSGNVWEWVSDWFDVNYYKNSPKDNPKGPSSGSYKALRGGSWRDDAGARVLRIGQISTSAGTFLAAGAATTVFGW